MGKFLYPQHKHHCTKLQNMSNAFFTHMWLVDLIQRTQPVDLVYSAPAEVWDAGWWFPPLIKHLIVRKLLQKGFPPFQVHKHDGMVNRKTYFTIQDTYCVESVKDFWTEKRSEAITGLQGKEVVLLDVCLQSDHTDCITEKTVNIHGSINYLCVLSYRRWPEWFSWTLCTVLLLHHYGARNKGHH